MLYYNTHKRVQRSKKKDQLLPKRMVLVVPVPKLIVLSSVHTPESGL
jgi:hypothetical protein